MFSPKDICHDKLFKIFIKERNITKRTIRSHAQAIRHYSNFHEMSPENLILEAEKEQDNGIKTYKRKVRKRLMGFIENLRKIGYSPFSIKSYLNSIKAFYHHFDIDTPRLRGIWKDKDKKRNLSHEKLPTKEDIGRILDVADIRDQAIILLHLSSGMGAGEVSYLTWRDFLVAYENYYVPSPEKQLDIFHVVNELEKIDAEEKNQDMGGIIGTWKISRIKTGMDYITYNTPESSKYILKYLEYRLNHNKPIKSLESTLFASYYNQRIKNSGYTLLFQRLNKKAGFKRRPQTGTVHPEGRHFITSHVLRKTFATMLYGARWDKLRVDWLLGHRIDDVSSAYFKVKPEILLEEYRKVIGELSVREEFTYHNVTDKDHKKALERIKELEGRQQDFEILKKKVEKLYEDREYQKRHLNL